jgi:hypothetical protein
MKSLNIIKSNINIFRGQYRKRILAPKNKKKIGIVQENYLENILSQLSEETVFLHVSLSSIKKAFNVNDPYNFLIGRLIRYFNNILVPGFTLDHFKETGIYHKIFSYPHEGLGTFSKLFFEKDSEYRTNDCIHSILVKGGYRFDDCNHSDSFCQEGCFGKIDKNNILILNIGTYEIKSSQIHFIDYNYNKNIVKKKYNGVIYYNNNYYEKIEQTNFEPKKNRFGLKYNWNRGKIAKDMINNGILKKYTNNNFNVFAIKSHDMKLYLGEKIRKNPYYLIS